MTLIRINNRKSTVEQAAGRLIPRRACTCSQSAFTIVELLAVIGIIITLAALGLLASRAISTGASVQGAVDTTTSMTLAARNQASTLGHGARLVIDANYDAANPEWYLRRMTVLEAVDPSSWDDSATPEWKMVDKATLLPKNVYFFEEYSSGFGTMQVDFRTINPQNGSQGGDAFYYEFDGNGRLIDASGSGELAKLIFVNGILADDGTLETPGKMLKSRDGLIIRSASRPAFFDGPDQITTSKTAP